MTTTNGLALGEQWAQTAPRRQAERVADLLDDVNRGDPGALGWGEVLYNAAHPRLAKMHGIDRATAEQCAEEMTGEDYPATELVAEFLEGVARYLDLTH